MKRTLFLLTLSVVLAGVMFAQANKTVYTAGSGQRSVIHAVTNWGPFSTDSAAGAFSSNFNIADYDSVDIFAWGTSSTGTAKWFAGFYVGFDNVVNATNYDSIGVAADTTNVKTETLQFIGRLPTHGAPLGVFQVFGSSVATHNPADSKVYLYAVGVKRQP